MKKIFTIKLLVITLFLVQPHVSLAQTEGIVPDRPGFSTGTFTVPVGQFYVESGYQFSFRDSYNLKASSFPALTVRTGLSAKSELFIGWDGIEINHSADDSDTGLPSIGSKYRLKESDLFNLTLLGVVSGSKDDDSFRIDPLIGLMWEMELTDGIGHFGGIQIESETEDSEREWLPALALGLEFELSGRFNTFVEYYTIYSGTEKELYHATEIGLLFYPVPKIQVDIFGGIGFNNEIPHYIGAGVSFIL